MEHNRTIVLKEFRESDQAVFTSLLTILSFKTHDEWTLVDDGDADVHVIDVDSVAGQNLAQTLEAEGHYVIRFSQQGAAQQSVHWLGKPLRAANILRCLNGFEEMDSDTPVLQTEKTVADVTTISGFRLRRWPCKQILESYPGASRLCAVMLKHTVTIEQAASMVQLPVDEVARFILECKQSQFVTELPIAVAIPQVEERTVKNAGLFDMLRQKFGSRG